MNLIEVSAYLLKVPIEDIKWAKHYKDKQAIKGRSMSLGYFKISVEFDPARDDGWCAK
jgi:hypothetical protein